VGVNAILPKSTGGRTHFEQAAIVRLADSIRLHGLLQPLTVRAAGERDGRCVYELISGERRLRACRLLGLTRLPCLVRETDLDRTAELSLLENLQHEQLDLFEQAEAIASLMAEQGLTQEQTARRLSASQSYVGNKLRLLRLREEEREIVRAFGLTERHVRALLRVNDEVDRLRLLKEAGSGGLTVSKTEELVERQLAVGAETAKETDGTPLPSGKRKWVIGDLGLFYNSIDRAAAMLREAGMAVDVEKSEDEGGAEVRVRIRRVKSEE